MINTILQGDCLDKLKELEDNSIDSIVTDPPYELGFMGKSWDNTGIANNPSMWAECLRVLKPGGHLLAFSGTRTYHRMAVAIEDAGFEVRDMIEWVYGSGFPKSLNIGKAVDKIQGNEREGTGQPQDKGIARWNKYRHGQYENTEDEVTKGTSEWEGWGTALKPAHEPICMARKPLAEKTVAENVLKYGTGGINIDESRVGTGDDRTQGGTGGHKTQFVGGQLEQKVERATGARFPANILHDNSEEVRECFPNESERFFKSIIYQAKASKSERNKGCEELEEKQTVGGGGGMGDYLEDVNSMSGKYGSEKAPNKNNHPTVKPTALMEYLIKMVTPKDGVVLDPFAGSGSTLVAAKQNGFQYIGIELTPEYIPIIEARLSEQKNTLF